MVVVVGVSVPTGNVAVCVDLFEPRPEAARIIRVIVRRKDAFAVDHAMRNAVAVEPLADDDARRVDPVDDSATHAMAIVDLLKLSVTQQVGFEDSFARLRVEHDVAIVVDAHCVRSFAPSVLGVRRVDGRVGSIVQHESVNREVLVVEISYDVASVVDAVGLCPMATPAGRGRVVDRREYSGPQHERVRFVIAVDVAAGDVTKSVDVIQSCALRSEWTGRRPWPALG
jgi:hypothetical protein